MGVPNSVTARISRGNRVNQEYDVEDTVNLLFDYILDRPEEKIVGNIIISRVYPKKEESLTVLGTEGIIEIQRGLIRRLDATGEEIEKLSRSGGWPSASVYQLEHFAHQINTESMRGVDHCKDHFLHVAIIEAAYASDATGKSYNPLHFMPTKEVKVCNLQSTAEAQ